MTATSEARVIWFDDLVRGDVGVVGGKNASLGEMVQNLSSAGIRVPPGFATTADAFWRFIDHNDLRAAISGAIAEWDAERASLHEMGEAIRSMILRGTWPDDIREAILSAYAALSERAGKPELSVAVRSSATAEDLPDASFAGQQETFLNTRGADALLDACRRCYASLFTDRALSYRRVQGFDHLAVALSVGVQQMVRSDTGGSGVMFSIDTETGFDRLVLINAAWGLGENVVQGAVTPDEYEVFKPLLDDPALSPVIEKTLGAKEIKMIYAEDGEHPTVNIDTTQDERDRFVLSDPEIVELARYAARIEAHYGCPMDMEWARDGDTGELFIVQARPETVQSRADESMVRSYQVHTAGPVLLRGLSIGNGAAAGPVCVIRSAEQIDRFIDGAVLVTGTTDPDWVPIMKRASAIVTDSGGRTSHAAIVSRELGLPAIVGTGTATALLTDRQEVTVNCAEGAEGTVHEGRAEITVEEVRQVTPPDTKTRVMLNLANPASATRWWRLPAAGVGLARMEFVIANTIRAHPMALHDPSVLDPRTQAQIATISRGFDSPRDFFVQSLSRGLAQIAATVWPEPAIVRMSDFKTNEYAALLGGAGFEPQEENPMIGFRGAARYTAPQYKPGFLMECAAIKHLRDEMGFTNVIVMIPFCRTPEEADGVLKVMEEAGLKRGENGLQVYVMCEIPSNVILAEEFAKRFDGFSIGSNDLTQLTLGVDRDSGELAHLFRERDPAVLWMIRQVIERAHASGRKVGLCGQAPSNDPEFARLLVEAGIDTISVTPDTFYLVKENVAAAEAE